jgi:hypothetical protein
MVQSVATKRHAKRPARKPRVSAADRTIEDAIDLKAARRARKEPRFLSLAEVKAKLGLK